jgi:hypothetical protein
LRKFEVSLRVKLGVPTRPATTPPRPAQRARSLRAGRGNSPCSYREFQKTSHFALESDVKQRRVENMPPWHPYSQAMILQPDILAETRVHPAVESSRFMAELDPWLDPWNA